MTNWTEAIGRPLRALHLDSLKKQVLVLAAAAAFLPALAMVVVAARRNRGSLDQEIAPVLRGASAEATWQIDRWLADRLDDLRVAATSYAVTDNLPRLQGRGAAAALGRLKDYLNSARERSSDCEALVLLDPHGKVVTASGGRMSGVQFSLERVNGLRTGDVLVGDAYWDTGIGKAALTLAVPIRQPDGRFAGALTAKFNLRAVGDLLQQAAPDSGGDAYVMTDQGRMVLRSDGSSADLMKIRLPPRTLETLLDKPGTMVASTAADGRDALATLRRLPALHWAVVVELPRGRALRQAGGTGAGTVLLLVFLVAAVGAIAGLCGWLVIRPVERLTRAAAQVAAGDLSVDIPSGGGGEVGQLTNVFRHLVTRVRERDSQGELERLSVTRTARKVGPRDLASAVVSGGLGATTVAGALAVCRIAGIHFMATGGLGGVHRGWQQTRDVSADTYEIAFAAVCVVCSGVKSSSFSRRCSEMSLPGSVQKAVRCSPLCAPKFIASAPTTAPTRKTRTRVTVNAVLGFCIERVAVAV